METETKIDLEGRESPHYWCGYLSSILEGVAEGRLYPERGDVQRALEEYQSSPVPRPREIVGFAVTDGTGECYAIETSYGRAETRRQEATSYLFGAGSSGHPAAQRYLRDRLPIRILTIDAEEREELLEQAGGTPTLEREP